MTEPLPLLDLIAQTLFDKKGSNILALDVRGISTMTDYLVIAEGNADRHVKALADALLSALEPLCGHPLRREGLHFADWAILDYGDIIIHLFVPELREYYALERLWRDGKIVKLHIDLSISPQRQE